jgi:hypothetical protein
MIYLLDVTHNDFTFHLKFSLTFMTLKVYYSVELFHLITNKKLWDPCHQIRSRHAFFAN